MTLAKQKELQNNFWAKIAGGVGAILLIIGFVVDYWQLWIIAGICIFYAIFKWSKFWKE